MIRSTLKVLAVISLFNSLGLSQNTALVSPPPFGVIRVATFNVSLHRKKLGELSEDLSKGDQQAERLAKIVQAVRPDILLANEVDYDGGKSASLLLDKYFAKGVSQEVALKYFFTSEVNTGVESKLDLDRDGKVKGPNDAWGYGLYPGQYGLVVYSRFPIAEKQVRTFQRFLWSQMPNALRPMKADGSPYWPDEVWNQLRLSSKTHMDVPIEVEGKVLHILASHPTPPVFDQEEDRNGCRNHDEIRLLADYINGGQSSEYLVSDQKTNGPLASDASFVILGDLNADPNDGSGRREAIQKLLQSPRVNASNTPRSKGGVAAAQKQGRANKAQLGDPAEDTGNFNANNPGNLRCDFVLPSSDCRIISSGVFWPSPEESAEAQDWLQASDHRLVWIDLQLPQP
jgi:endonuclease/exonuclease/phosphatase family metal-dependent hydrolase